MIVSFCPCPSLSMTSGSFSKDTIYYYQKLEFIQVYLKRRRIITHWTLLPKQRMLVKNTCFVNWYTDKINSAHLITKLNPYSLLVVSSSTWFDEVKFAKNHFRPDFCKAISKRTDLSDVSFISLPVILILNKLLSRWTCKWLNFVLGISITNKNSLVHM